ncbi:tyrosine-type recombinase/integrase [Salipiger abyssi]|uniref:tyrosine-type recombinase/integrase n=1 Tax=Salipiger abyssi TaxID=1250539 RepID=UPI0012EC089A|nr:tyrosine-type recombinase/integrase [Salipiger abyssi]
MKLDWQGDARELDRLYWLAQGGKHKAQVKPSNYTWRECIETWRRDPIAGQGKLKPSTKASYRRTMDAIMAKNGAKDMRKTTRQAVRAALENLAETPRKASRHAQTISLLWNYAATELDWPLGENPARRLARYKPAREIEPWPAWMVEKLDSAPENVRIAARLILGTGQRPNAAITMRRDQINGEWMRVRDEKGDKWLEVFCPKSLRDFTASLPIRGDHFLARNLREPLGYQGVERAFRAWRKGLGENAAPYTMHGLRKLAIVELAEAGSSDAEIQSVTGQSAEMVAYYRKRANKRALSKIAQERRK